MSSGFRLAAADPEAERWKTSKRLKCDLGKHGGNIETDSSAEALHASGLTVAFQANPSPVSL
jgi:hypothetical protein